MKKSKTAQALVKPKSPKRKVSRQTSSRRRNPKSGSERIISSSLSRLFRQYLQPKIDIHVLPGGMMPQRQTGGAIGYDAHLRAVVSSDEMDQRNPVLRKTLFDFKRWPSDAEVKKHVQRNGTDFAYQLMPGESVLVGIGFVTAMPFPMFYWVAPRSGLSTRAGITVTNAPGTVDPDYRGEAGVLVYNRTKKPYNLTYGMRIAQIIFQWALIPQIRNVASVDRMSKTKRGTGGFGSTGIEAVLARV